MILRTTPTRSALNESYKAQRHLAHTRFVIYTLLVYIGARHVEKAIDNGIAAGAITKQAKKMAASALTDIRVMMREIERGYTGDGLDNFLTAHDRHCAIMAHDISIFYFSVKQWLDNRKEDHSGAKAHLIVAEAMMYGATTYFAEMQTVQRGYGIDLDLRMFDCKTMMGKLERILSLMKCHKASQDDTISLAWSIIVKKIGSEDTINKIIEGLT